MWCHSGKPHRQHHPYYFHIENLRADLVTGLLGLDTLTLTTDRHIRRLELCTYIIFFK